MINSVLRVAALVVFAVCGANAFAGGPPLTCPTISMAPTSLANGDLATAYTATVTSSNGAAPVTIDITHGILPNGVNLADNGDGTATFSGKATQTGTFEFTITATDVDGCSGGRTYAPTFAAAISSTALALTTGPNPSLFGQSLTFTATVTSASGTPTGSVTFKDGAATLGTVALDGGGQATFTTSTLTVGTHSPITAVYAGSAGFAGSTSNALSQTVNQAATTTSLIADINPSVFGQSVTFTATVAAVAPGSGTPTGTVTFSDGATTLGSGTLNGSGVATFATSALSAGPHSISATYGADVNFSGSTSSVLSQTVNQAATATAVAPVTNPSVFGQSVTCTAAVTAVAPGAGTPTGTVTFLDGVTNLGTGTLNGSGVATFTTSALTVGGHPITASYGADTNFSGSTSTAVNQTVNQAATTTALVSSLNPSAANQSVTFTATVAAVAPGAGIPTGTVTFFDGATSIGPGALNGAGQATFTSSTLSVGSHSITATYAGDTNFTASTSAPLNQTVNLNSSATALISSVNPSVFGQATTFTATVTSGAGVPTGAVAFMDGPILLNTSPLVAGVATFTTGSLAVGAHTITAIYSGDSNFASSTSAPLTQAVNQAATTTTVGSSANPSAFDQSVTLTATVAAVAPGSGTPTGTVTFKDGVVVLGAPVALNGSGQATFTTGAFMVGAHPITATYSADANFLASDNTASPLIQTVNQAATTTTLGTSGSPSVFGQSVTFTATVSAVAPGAGTPTGTVQFKDGAANLGAPASLAGGVATFNTSSLSVSTHSITAVYSADANFTASTSSALSQVVNKSATTTTVVSSLNPSVSGQSVTFTATVTATAPGAGTPTGNVDFKDGATTIGSGALAAGVATFATTTLSVGTHSITAVYGADANFNGSTSSALSQVVNKAPTTTTVASSLNPSVFQNPVTFTATVTSTSPGTPTGSVNFLDGATSIGSSVLSGGVATFTTATLTGGTHSITAVYGGDAAFATSTSTALSQVVNPASQTITFTAPPAFVATSTTFTATATATSGLTVVFTIDATSTSACSVAGTTVTTGATAGTCVINANQAGDGNWLAAPQVTRSTTVLVPANADADSDAVTGNVAISVPVGPNSVLTGDTGTNIAIISYGVTGTEQATIGAATPTTKGGSVILNADGSYKYDPPANFTGTGANADTFKYKIDNALNQPSIGTVTLTVSDRIMIVATTGVGLANCKPATACLLATADAALAVTAGKDLVFVQSGAYANATFSLLANQAIVGQKVALAQALVDAGITLAPDSVTPVIGSIALPTLTNAATVLTLGGGNLIEYFNINPTVGAAISGAAAVTGTTTANSIVITSSGTANAIALVSQDAGHTFNLDNNSSITHSSNAAAVSLTGAGGQGPVNIAAPISSTSGSPVTVTGRTGGTVAFTGAVSGTVQGISLTGNTGSTINFNAPLTLSTGANAAFTATGGGTVAASDTTSTLTTTTGTALNVANTTIGAAGLKFRSISAGTAASGPTNAIVLNTTTPGGGLTVSGTGAAGSGGVIQKTTGDAIVLTSTGPVSLSTMTVQNGTHRGINGLTLGGFTLINSSVINNGSTANVDNGIKLLDVSGTATFTNDTVTGNHSTNLFFGSSIGSSTTTTSLTVTNGSYSNSVDNTGIQVIMTDTSKLKTATITGVTFSSNFSSGLDVQSNGGSIVGDGVGVPATGTVTVSGSTFTNNGVAAMDIDQGGANGAGQVYARLMNNTTITGNGGPTINIFDSSSATGGTMKVRIDGNHVGNAAVAGSGSTGGPGVRAFLQGKTTNTITIVNNIVRQTLGSRAIDIEAIGPVVTGQPLTVSDIVVTGNDVDTNDELNPSGSLDAVYVAADDQGSPAQINAEIHGNTIPSATGLHGCYDFPTFDGNAPWMDYRIATSGGVAKLFNFGGHANANTEISTTQTSGTAGADTTNFGGVQLTLVPVNSIP